MSHDLSREPICRHTYVLRLWREGSRLPWRLALREVDDSTTIGLADLDELVVFLLRQMGGQIDLEPNSANNDSYTTAEDTPLVVAAPGLLANDTEPTPAPHSIPFAPGSAAMLPGALSYPARELKTSRN